MLNYQRVSDEAFSSYSRCYTVPSGLSWKMFEKMDIASRAIWKLIEKDVTT